MCDITTMYVDITMIEDDFIKVDSLNRVYLFANKEKLRLMLSMRIAGYTTIYLAWYFKCTQSSIVNQCQIHNVKKGGVMPPGMEQIMVERPAKQYKDYIREKNIRLSRGIFSPVHSLKIQNLPIKLCSCGKKYIPVKGYDPSYCMFCIEDNKNLIN